MKEVITIDPFTGDKRLHGSEDGGICFACACSTDTSAIFYHGNIGHGVLEAGHGSNKARCTINGIRSIIGNIFLTKRRLSSRTQIVELDFLASFLNKLGFARCHEMNLRWERLTLS